jgi:hypothetical protein
MTPPAGEPDDRLQRGTQYAAASYSGILGEDVCVYKPLPFVKNV